MVDQPDRDSMVTPKLDESDYKPDTEKLEEVKDEVKAEDKKHGDHINEPPSSSDIKPEEPSSTTSPKPSEADKIEQPSQSLEAVEKKEAETAQESDF